MEDIPEVLEQKKYSAHSFALPNISKTQQKLVSFRTSRSTKTRHHSVFLDKIKDLTKDVKYDELEIKKINEEQKQLKYLLRQFNQETYNILGRYIDRPILESKNKKERATSTSMMEVKEKEITNSSNMLELCKKQIQSLQRKCQNLKYVTVQDFEHKINAIKSQIQQFRNSNKQITKSNTLNGLAIKKGDIKYTNNHQISQMEEEKIILEKKKQRLTQDMKYVTEEQEKLRDSQSKAEEDIKKLTQQYKKYEKEYKQSKDQKQLSRLYEQKKKELDLKKEKIFQKQYLKQDQELAQSQQKNLKELVLKVVQKTQQNEKDKKAKQNIKEQDNQVSLNLIKKRIALDDKKQSKLQKKQLSSNRYQYQYLKKLKQFEETLKKIKQLQGNINQAHTKIEKSRKQVQQHELKLLTVKKIIQKNENLKRSQTNDKNKEKVQGKQEQNGQNGKKWFFF